MVERPSDRDFACFFCGKGKTKNLSSSCPECDKPLNVGLLFEGQRISNYRLRHYVDRGYYGATYQSENNIGKLFAVKLIPKILYTEHEKNFEEEIVKYRQLGSHPNIAELIDAGEGQVTADGVIVPVYYVVTEWIEGQSLTDFIRRPEFSPSEMFGAILDLASGVARFESRNLWHNDLNGENVLVKKLTPDEMETRRCDSEYICKIVDLGSSIFRQSERHKVLDDVKFLGQHINSMRTALLGKPHSLSKEDGYFLNELGKVVAHILDENPTRSANKVQTALDEIKALHSRRHSLGQDESVTLTDPFSRSCQ